MPSSEIYYEIENKKVSDSFFSFCTGQSNYLFISSSLEYNTTSIDYVDN